MYKLHIINVCIRSPEVVAAASSAALGFTDTRGTGAFKEMAAPRSGLEHRVDDT